MKWPTHKPGPWLSKLWTPLGNMFRVYLVADKELLQLDGDELWELAQRTDSVMFAGFGYVCHDCHERRIPASERYHTYHDIPLPDGRVERRHRYVCPKCADTLRVKFRPRQRTAQGVARMDEVQETVMFDDTKGGVP